MNLQEYAAYDALGLARLVERREVSPRELAETALEAIEAWRDRKPPIHVGRG
jgi:amidase